MKDKFKNNKIKIIIFIGLLFTGITGAFAATTIFASSEVSYSNSDMEATNVQDAIDELWTKANSCGDSKYTGTVYRKSGLEVQNGATIPTDRPFYCLTYDGIYGHGPADKYSNQNECEDDHINKYGGSSSLSCQLIDSIGMVVGTYTKSQSEIQKDNIVYIKHNFEQGVITASYVCFVMGGEEFCLKGADTSALATNLAILKAYQSFYNLNEVTNPSYNNPSYNNPGCSYGAGMGGMCCGGAFYRLLVNSGGLAEVVSANSSSCSVTSDNNGSSKCQ